MGLDFERNVGAFARDESAWLDVVATVVGDCDHDCDVDLADLLKLESCITGPGRPAESACSCADVDGDGDVDLADFLAFQASFTGPR